MPSADSPRPDPQAARHWRLLFTPPAAGAINMGLDEALMARAAATGEWVLRVYGWSRPTLSLGRNQRAAGLYDEKAMQAAGVDVVRRPTGGRGLLHDAEVTYSVTGPVTGAGSLREVYDRINRVLVHGLRSIGVEASIAGAREGARSLPPGSAPCFDLPAPGELVAGGRKLAGSAQWREGPALLQHGSILVEGDQRLVAELLRAPAPAPPAPATLRDILGRAPALGTVADALFDAVRALEDRGATPLGDAEALLDSAETFCARHRDSAWIWRR